MAKTTAALAEAGATIYEISEDKYLRQQLEAREDALRQERGMLRRLENAEKERDEAIAERDAVAATIAEKDAELSEKDATIADKEAKLAAAYELLRKHGIDPNEAEV